jgi:hypothetical protein
MGYPMTDEIDFDLQVITISHKRNDPPSVDIGNASPMEAYGVLAAAMQTINLLIPHCTISSNGKELLSILDYSDDDES